MNKQADAYIRDGFVICVPCSDIEDRDRPTKPRTGSRCAICGEPFGLDGLGSAFASGLANMTPLERSRLTGQ